MTRIRSLELTAVMRCRRGMMALALHLFRILLQYGRVRQQQLQITARQQKHVRGGLGSHVVWHGLVAQRFSLAKHAAVRERIQVWRTHANLASTSRSRTRHCVGQRMRCELKKKDLTRQSRQPSGAIHAHRSFLAGDTHGRTAECFLRPRSARFLQKRRRCISKRKSDL